MPIPLPNLDTRRWVDLVEEGRVLLPRYAPGWTDHNVHDPGITLIELLAWVVEQSIYRSNRVSDRHRRKFLGLAGFPPSPPRPAFVTLAFDVPAAGAPVIVPAGLVFLASVPGAPPIPFRTTVPVTVIAVHAVALQVFAAGIYTDRTRWMEDGLAFPLLGPDPSAAADPEATPAFYLGLDAPPPAGSPLTCFLRFVEGDGEERRRLGQEARAAAEACRRPPWECPPCLPAPDWCAPEEEPGGSGTGGGGVGSPLLPHHSARTVWEFWDGGVWRALDPGADEVVDETRSLTIDGFVRLSPPAPMVARLVGAVTVPLHYLRCRLADGRYDAAPELIGLALNAAPAEQASSAHGIYRVAAGVVPASPIVPGARHRLAIEIDATGVVTSLDLTADGSGPEALVLAHTPATPAGEGSLALDLAPVVEWGEVPAVSLHGTGLPEQHGSLPGAPLARGEAAVWTLEGTEWRSWSARPDLDASAPEDAHSVLDPDTGTLSFGDGARGRVPPAGAAVLAAYATTRGAGGRIPAAVDWTLDLASPFNAAILGGDPAAWAAGLGPTRNPFPATAGGDAEGVGDAAARAAAFLWAHERLVDLCADRGRDTIDQLDRVEVEALPAPPRAATLLDCERIALDVPGTRVRRARAWAGIDPRYPGASVPGTTTLVVVPTLPVGRPEPTAGLLRAVRQYLDRRRLLCTRLVVVGPTYLEVAVSAVIATRAGADPSRVQQAVEEALRTFLDPLSGGPDGRGWPFGRDVYRSEVLAVVRSVPGVDWVDGLVLSGGAATSCANVCVPPTWLVASGVHRIQVVRG